jgi:hypothetical protein
MAAIRHEHKWLKNMNVQYRFDGVISDNRFGLYHNSVPSIFLTHQLHIRSGMGKWIDIVLQRLNYSYINRFKLCWVPDCKGRENLAGELSHPDRLPESVSYLGPLSRFGNFQPDKQYDIAVILSGPEPQRSLLEKKVISQLKIFTGTAMLVRGLPAKSIDSSTIGNIEIISHLPSSRMSRIIAQSGLVITRSGYSSIMDLVCLRKKAVLIPTPGQPEQEYLATYLHSKSMFYTVEQDQFDLTKVLERVASFPFAIPEFDMTQYKKEILQFVESL